MAKVKLRFNAGVEYKNKVYASTVNLNGLFQLDLITQELIYLTSFTKEEACFAIHRIAFLYGNEAWFIPQNGRYIAIVNLDTLDIEYLEPPFNQINEDAVSRINAVYYSGNIIEEKYLYLIPTTIDTLLLIDLEKKKLYPYYDITKKQEYFLYGTYANECIYLTPYTGKDLLVINLRTNERKRYPWKYKFYGFTDMIYYENKIWFSPYTSDKILSLDLKEKKVKLIPLSQYYDEKCTYEQIIINNKHLYFIPFQADKVLKLNVENLSLTQIDIKPELLENEVNGFCRIFSKNKIILASYSKNAVLIYNQNHDKFNTIKLEIERNHLAKSIEKISNIQYKNLVHAEYFQDFFGVKEYICLLKKVKDISVYQSKNIGGNIWEKLKCETY